MRIGQLAERAGVTVQTIRYYERRGLLKVPVRRASGYRAYTDQSVADVRAILQLKELGFTLGEIRAALSGHEGDDTLCRLAATKVTALRSEIERLTQVLDALEERRRICGCDRPTRIGAGARG
jgi:MerR family copper efflux transcriptional regulator